MSQTPSKVNPQDLVTVIMLQSCRNNRGGTEDYVLGSKQMTREFLAEFVRKSGAVLLSSDLKTHRLVKVRLN